MIPLNLMQLLEKTDDRHRSICVRVNKKDYYSFLHMCKDNDCHYEDGSEIEPNNTDRCGYLIEIKNDRTISTRRGMRVMSLTGCWHFNFTDVMKGLYLPIKNGCLDLSRLVDFQKNSFMNETVMSIVLPHSLAGEINRLFRGTDYKSFFNIYYCGNYEEAVRLINSFEIEELNGYERNIRVIPYGGNCIDNLTHAYDKNGYVKRWVWGKKALPELLKERQIVNSIIVPGGELYVYRYIDPETMIYVNTDSLVKGTLYRNQICLHDEKRMLPKIERYLEYLNYKNYIYIEQCSMPGNERAYLVDLDNREKEYLGKVNYIDKEEEINVGITVRTKDEKIMNYIGHKALQAYMSYQTELYHIIYSEEEHI